MAARWFYIKNGEQHGPILPDGLKALADRGLLNPSDPVRADDSSEWVPARRLIGLFAAPISLPHIENVPDLLVGQPVPCIHDEPMIPFWPLPAVTPPAEPLSQPPWQFSLKDLWIAVGMVAAACGVGAMVVNAHRLADSAPFEYGIVTYTGIIGISAFLGGAIGVLIGKPGRWLLSGGLVGLMLGAAILGLLTLFAIVGTIVFSASLDGRKEGERGPDQMMVARQKSIYRLSAISCVILLFVWLPIPFMVNSNGACRPMGQAMVTMLFVLPMTIIAICKAIIQLVVEWPEEKQIGLKAIVAAVLPILVYEFTQWLILSACGIIYED